ncbi:MAG: hypothetical protein H7Y61_11190 [Rhizobiales bacterium]|nr:hypothetical protein [Rhizobacter sp.]
MGALAGTPPPALHEWTAGILEFSNAAGDGARSVPRRLVLRNAMADPTRGIIFELYRPELIDVQHPRMRVRGIEPTSLGTGPVCAMVQYWLVILS